MTGSGPGLLGSALRVLGPRNFTGKGRLVHYWITHRDPGQRGTRRIGTDGLIECDFSVPYEAMVWARQEEERELAFLRSLLRPGDHFVDCGANLGLWSLTAADCVGPAGHVTAFEPGPVAWARLQQNLTRSPGLRDRITAVNAAVSSRRGEAAFLAGHEHNSGRITRRHSAETVCVPTTTLDDYFLQRPIDGLKLDIEGGEHDALRGGEQILRRQRPWIVIEFNALISGKERLCDWDVLPYLQRLGYACRSLGHEPLSPMDPIRGYVNVIFVPGECHPA